MLPPEEEGDDRVGSLHPTRTFRASVSVGPTTMTPVGPSTMTSAGPCHCAGCVNGGPCVGLSGTAGPGRPLAGRARVRPKPDRVRRAVVIAVERVRERDIELWFG